VGEFDARVAAMGRSLAARRGVATTRYFLDLFEALREDGLEDFRIEDLVCDGLTLVVAAPTRCVCGAAWQRTVSEEPGMKRPEIRLEHRCRACGDRLQLRFCRPRLLTLES
jgi:hypothetical protein